MFRPLRPSLAERAIQLYQKGPFSHAAVYLQADHDICESSPKTDGVAITSLEDRLKKYCILVRRVRNVNQEGRAEIATMVTSLINAPYGFASICNSVIQRLTGLHLDIKLTKSLKEPVVCSTLCEHGILAATKGSLYLTRSSHMLLMPEDLASTDLLEDVNITWKAVEP